jgi:hypothetical protein
MVVEFRAVVEELRANDQLRRSEILEIQQKNRQCLQQMKQFYE